MITLKSAEVQLSKILTAPFKALKLLIYKSKKLLTKIKQN